MSCELCASDGGTLLWRDDFCRVVRADVAEVCAAFDPLRTAIFTPHERVDVFAAAHANGVAHVYRRGALATALPRVLDDYGGGAWPAA